MKKKGLNCENDSTVEYDGWHLYKKKCEMVEVVPFEEGRIELSAKVKFCERFAKQSHSNIQFKIFSNRELDELDAILSQQNYCRTKVQLLMIKKDMAVDISRNEKAIIKIIESSNNDFLNRRDALGLHEISIGDKECICEIVVDGKIVGSAFSTINECKMGIFNVLVNGNFRREGYGELLLRALFHWGRTRGSKNAYLNVNNTNVAAISLYQKIGFIIESRIWIREKTL